MSDAEKHSKISTRYYMFCTAKQTTKYTKYTKEELESGVGVVGGRVVVGGYREDEMQT